MRAKEGKKQKKYIFDVLEHRAANGHTCACCQERGFNDPPGQVPSWGSLGSFAASK